MAFLPKIALSPGIILVASLSFVTVIHAADSAATPPPATSPSATSSLAPSASSHSSYLCPAKYAEKHEATDKLIGDPSKLIPGSHFHSFDNKAKETVTFAMAGEKNQHVIVVSMPGIQLGQFDFGGTTSNSTVRVSIDGGKNFDRKLENETFFGRKENGLQPSPIDKNKIVLVGYGPDKEKRTKESTLWISVDAGVSWTRHLTPGFRLDGNILFHAFEPNLLLAYSNSANFSVHLSTDFGRTWKMMKELVRAVHWGFYGETIFVTVDPGVGVYGTPPNGELMKSEDKGKSWTTVLKNVHSFGLEGKFLYASVDEAGNRDKRVLKVSTDDGNNWKHVQLPVITPDRFYSILDMSQELIFIHVSNPGSLDFGQLYTSGSDGAIFSESLERNLFTHTTVTDFYRVKGMRGVYLTSKVNKDDTLTTMITYDRGATWQRLPMPTNLPAELQNADCGSTQPRKCSLQLHISFSVSQLNAAPQGPLSIANATGLIISHGHVGDSLRTKDTKVFISSDGGVSWRYTGLSGYYFYQILDFGGLIVAVKIPPKSPTDADAADAKLIYFSTDEGRCWHRRNFTDKDIQVKGLRADPKGHSMNVNVWGMTKDASGNRKWVVVSVDFSVIVKNECKRTDYNDWTPMADTKKKGCLLGEKYTYKRLKPESFCHNKESILNETSSSACKCEREDYECAYGFERDTAGDCIRSRHVEGEAERPMLCIGGKVYQVDDQKYRKIPGDKCDENDAPFQPKSFQMTLVSPLRTCEADSRAFLVAKTTPAPPPKTPAQRTALAATVFISLVLFAVCTLFFARKVVSLRNDKGSYRYSSVRATDDDEFEALIPNGGASNSGGLGDYVVAADDDDDNDFDLEMELERGLAELSAPLPSSASSSSFRPAADRPAEVAGNQDSPPELAVSASKSPIKAPTQTTNIRSYLSDSDDDLIA